MPVVCFCFKFFRSWQPGIGYINHVFGRYTLACLHARNLSEISGRYIKFVFAA
jgi:hypothetical protein